VGGAKEKIAKSTEAGSSRLHKKEKEVSRTASERFASLYGHRLKRIRKPHHAANGARVVRRLGPGQDCGLKLEHMRKAPTRKIGELNDVNEKNSLYGGMFARWGGGREVGYTVRGMSSQNWNGPWGSGDRGQHPKVLLA